MTSTAIGSAPQARPGRVVTGICAPYGELSYLTPNPYGERILPGAFAASVGDPSKVFLFRGHDHAHPVGRGLSFTETPEGLVGSFVIRDGELGDELLRDVAEGYLPAMSVGFKPVQVRRGANGETEVVSGMLKEVSVLPIGAYDGAKVLALRGAGQPVAEIPHIPATAGHPEPVPGMVWESVAPSVRHLLGPEAVGRPQPARRPPYVARKAELPAGAQRLQWRAPAHLQHLLE